MITLFRKPDCWYCNDIEEELKELVIAHRVINIEKAAADINKNYSDIPLPFIEDDGKIISGFEEMQRYLEELKKFISLWRKYQTDACYTDNEGNTG
jgi:glutaredoxin